MKDNPFDPKTGQATADMINAFLKWKLPKSVRSDRCCSEPNYSHDRWGTNLLTLPEAMQMIQEVVCPIIAKYSATPTTSAGEDGELLIIDAAVEVAVFSKTHEWPKEMSPDFFKFAQLLDDLATKIQARYPEFNKNVRAAKSNSPSAGAEGGKL